MSIIVSSGITSTGLIVENNTMEVYGSAVQTTVSSGGRMYTFDGGTADHTDLNSGNLYISSGGPMNTREMVKAAAGKGYWTPTARKTPEQTLYASISREIKTKDRPRIVRSDAKGKFTIAG